MGMAERGLSGCGPSARLRSGSRPGEPRPSGAVAPRRSRDGELRVQGPDSSALRRDRLCLPRAGPALSLGEAAAPGAGPRAAVAGPERRGPGRVSVSVTVTVVTAVAGTRGTSESCVRVSVINSAHGLCPLMPKMM